MKRFCALVLLLCAAWAPSEAKIKLPAIVGDNMVLQQSCEVKLWGWAAPEAEVSVAPSWCGAVRTQADKKGRWCVTVATPAASFEPRSIALGDGDGEPVVLKNILIGEVWLSSGQSNMEIPVQGGRDCPIEHAQEIIAESAQYPDVRLFSVKIDGGLRPREDVTGAWCEASPGSVKTFSAIGYLFGRNLRRALNVPVGIINSSCGGTWIEAWFPASLQREFADFDPASVATREGQSGMNTVEILYNGMIYPLHNFAIKGFCWYQGCSNVGRSTCYADKMVAMIDHWRELWGGERKPFYYVEIAPHEDGEQNVNEALVREQQARVMDMTDNVGMVCTNDLVYDYETWNVHPSQKEPIARRLAYWALSRDYGYGDAVKTIGPRFRSMEVLEGGVVRVHFDGSDCGFLVKGEIEGFELAGSDGVFRPAKAVRRRPDPTVLYVSNYDVGSPVYLRYNFKNCSVGRLWDAFGQPVVPFRTDNF